MIVMDATMMQNWLETETAGSPFIIIEEVNLIEWEPTNYYEEICAVENYIEKININNKAILVFGDESMPLKLINNNDEIVVFRWVYAPDKITVENVIETLDYKTLPIMESVSVNWNTNNFVLMDSLKYYNEAGGGYLKINAKNKNWKINTMEYKNNDVCLIIHQIKME